MTSAVATSPMKLLIPRSRGDSVWAYTSNFGGGLVAGDQTELEIHTAPETRCFLGTQSSTKIYRNPDAAPCGHFTRAHLESNSLLVFVPDPVQAFAQSHYVQRQEFHLAANASLVLLDWFSAGRVARGERWEFSCLQSRNEVFCAGERVFLDSLLLDASCGTLNSPHRTGRFNCFLTLFVFGERLAGAAQAILSAVSSRPVERHAPLVCCVSQIRNGLVLWLAAESMTGAAHELQTHLDHFIPLLGDNPWSRKW